MTRAFVGVGHDRHGGPGGSDVYVVQNGERQRLTRRVRRLEEGYSWDQAGPRSTELARAMLWLISGVDPPWALYRGFTSDVVAHFPVPVCEGECWRLSEAEILEWLRDVGWLTATDAPGVPGVPDASIALSVAGEPGEHPAATGARQRAINSWKQRARSAVTLFRKQVAA
jgi:hypothetical protein